MPKRKPEADQPENDGTHRSKKPKTDGLDHKDSTAASAARKTVPPPDQKSVEESSRKSKEANKRTKEATGQQGRRSHALSESVLQKVPESKGDAKTAGQPPKAEAFELRELQKLQKKERRKERRQQCLESQAAPDSIQHQGSNLCGDAIGPRQSSQKREAKQRKRRPQNGQRHRDSKTEVLNVKIIGKKGRDDAVPKTYKTPPWSVSEAIGGQMLDLDPLFSCDEEYLLIAHQSSVNVYATATSLLVRKLRLGHSKRISTFAFSSSDPSRLYTATQSGTIQLWDWLEGRELRSWYAQCIIHALATSKVGSESEPLDLVYSINRKETGPGRISAHQLGLSQDADDSDLVTLRTSREPITSFKIIENGKLIIATSGTVLTLGSIDHSGQSPLSSLSYTWRDIECPEWISCIDVRTIEPTSDSKKNRSSDDQQIPRIDLVLGGLKGSVHVYDDLLGQLSRSEKRSEKGPVTNLISRTKHWHRNAVLAVKWSLDGNYIVSGGLETVLLVWQLETGNLDTLPHLGASIEGIVVSPSGSSYAIHLADNSAMILSTSELKPTFSVAGIQLPVEEVARTQLPFISNVDAPVGNSKPSRRLRFPVAAGPLGLLCAVPGASSSRVPSGFPQHTSYLQTFDVPSAQQISRQALTRTKATDLNVGPESNTIEEPDVVLMQISRDGRWLATVDEWMPPKRDMDLITYDDEQAIEAQAIRKEIYLKFWSFNNDSKVWELVSRVENPHASQADVADKKFRVLDLTSSPSRNAYATVGEDGIVRIWTPLIRQRHGLPVKNSEGQGLTDWRCQSTVSLDPGASSPQPCMEAKLAYSSDGSCLAAASVSSSPWTVHLIDTSTGNIQTGPYGPFTGSLSGLGILDRFLILLSDQLCVWDLVTQELIYGFGLAPQASPSVSLTHSRHMAVDTQRGTFAIALSNIDPSNRGRGRAKHRSDIMIFEPTDPTPIFVQNFSQPVTALTTLYNRPGYLDIDSAAEIRILTPTLATVDPGATLPSPPHTPSQGLRDIYGESRNRDLRAEEARKQIAASIPTGSVEPRVDDEEANVVPQEKLAEVFDVGPAYALPPVTEMFERVARLFAGKREG